MYVRVCRYRVYADLMERYMAVQRRAAEVYHAHGGEHVTYYQSEHDPCEWMEIRQYASRAACQVLAARLGQQPEIMALWDQFQATLDPSFPFLVEEFQQRSWLSTDDANSVFEDELQQLLPENPS